MAKSDSTRTVGKEGMGGSGDMKDRMRGTYKPGANPPIPSPLDEVEKWVKRQMGKMKKGKRK